MGCEDFLLVVFLFRIKWQYSPCGTKKCKRYLPSSTSLNELALDLVP